MKNGKIYKKAFEYNGKAIFWLESQYQIIKKNKKVTLLIIENKWGKKIAGYILSYNLSKKFAKAVRKIIF